MRKQVDEQLTPRQEEYLLLFATMGGHRNCLANAAEYFGVSKPTAFAVVESLQQRGLVQKAGRGEISLTQQGVAYIDHKLSQWRGLARWLQSDFGLTPLVAEGDARRMVTSMTPDTIDRILRRGVGDVDQPKNQTPFRTTGQLVPFQVFKPDGKHLSMGDRGFEKPAMLSYRGGEYWLLLKANHIRYEPLGRNAKKGALDRLWYVERSRWVEVEGETEHVYPIPFFAVSRQAGGKSGILKIRARANVGIFTMPESEALIVLDISQINLEETP